MLCDVEVNDPPAVMDKDDEDEQDPTRDGRYGEEIHRAQRRYVIGEERSPCLRRRATGRLTSLETVRSDTSMPSLPNSPWMRGAPQSGFALAIFITSVRMAAFVRGRPGRPRAERRAHWRRSHWRCQRTTVSGSTTIRAVRQSRHALASSIQNSRSLWRSRGRLTLRLNTANC